MRPKMQNINPRVWLTDTLNKVQHHNIQKLEELLPGYQNTTTWLLGCLRHIHASTFQNNVEKYIQKKL